MKIIQEKRIALGIKQGDFALSLKVDRSTVSKWETGRAMPRAELLPKIAGVLCCTVDELLKKGDS